MGIDQAVEISRAKDVEAANQEVRLAELIHEMPMDQLMDCAIDALTNDLSFNLASSLYLWAEYEEARDDECMAANARRFARSFVHAIEKYVRAQS